VIGLLGDGEPDNPIIQQPDHPMTQQLCERCRTRPAAVRLRRSRRPAQTLCENCFRACMQGERRQARLDVARFFSLLARPQGRRSALELPAMPPATTCPGCGLRYDEFAQQGLAGCAACYTAFADAILPALSLLRNREG